MLEPLPQGSLTRLETGEEGTFGEFILGDFKCVTVELPWRDNKPEVSCIPEGSYVFRWREDSPKHGKVYEAEFVHGRSSIQIHSANLAGDESKGYVKQLDGCIALGRAIIQFKAGSPPAGKLNQYGVVSSKAAVSEMAELMVGNPFALKVSWLELARPK